MRAALLTLVIAAASPWVLSAQQQTEEELVREIERLIPLVREASEDADRASAEKAARDRAAAEAAAQVDTFSVGDLTIIAPVADRERAERLFTDVWPEFAGLGSERLAEFTFTYQDGRDELPIFVSGWGRDIDVQWWHNDDEARERVRDQLVVVLSAELMHYNHPIYRWSGVSPVGEVPWETIYYNVATVAAEVSRDCLAGDLDRCIDALMLSEHEDGHAQRWYTGEERVLVARGMAMGANFDPDLYELCRIHRDVEACDAFFESRAPRSYAPYPGFVHSALVTMAMERGGEGAWKRLVDSSDEQPREILERVSGVSIEELVEEWHAELVANRPQVHAGALGRTAATLLWFVFFATLALRSTRWRLG